MIPTILTHGGTYFNLRQPIFSRIDIETIAHALAHICRFTGHTTQFYSVAQHAYHVSFIVPEEYALEGLLHDAAEAYIGDVAAPLKQLLPDYKAIEANVERSIFTYFGILQPLPACIKQADLIMLATEDRDLMPAHDDNWFAGTDIVPLLQPLIPLSPNVAKRLFLDRYHHLIAMRSEQTACA